MIEIFVSIDINVKNLPVLYLDRAISVGCLRIYQWDMNRSV